MTEDEWYQDLKDTGYAKDTFQQEVIWLEEYVKNIEGIFSFKIDESKLRLAALKRLVGEMDD